MTCTVFLNKAVECRLADKSLLASMPDIILSVGLFRFKVDPLDLLDSCIEDNVNAKDKVMLICSLKIVEHDKEEILGLPFFYSNLVVFDKQNKRIGRRR